MTERERRMSPRFLLRLPLTVRWTNQSGACEAVTETRDVSSRGLRFHLPKTLKNGSAVEILMTLPKQLLEAGPVCVRCQGRVVRSLEGVGKIEVAATIDKFQLMRVAEDGHSASRFNQIVRAYPPSSN